MKRHSIVMVGGPDSGKTNYLARLWEAFRSAEGGLVAPDAPGDIGYVEEALAHLLGGEFAPRSDTNVEDSRRNFAVPLALAEDPKVPVIDVVVPDVSGELWRGVVETNEIPTEWMRELKQASGALVFVRVLSKLNVAPLDWVAAEKLMSSEVVQAAAEEDGGEGQTALPTQVSVCELLRFLSLTLKTGPGGRPPRVALVVTAWDLLNKGRSAAGPRAYIRREYPLLGGRIDDIDELDVRVFGVSVVGGDLIDPKFQAEFLEAGLNGAGYVVEDTEKGVQHSPDVTRPVAWVVEGLTRRP